MQRYARYKKEDIFRMPSSFITYKMLLMSTEVFRFFFIK